MKGFTIPNEQILKALADEECLNPGPFPEKLHYSRNSKSIAYGQLSLVCGQCGCSPQEVIDILIELAFLCYFTPKELE